MAEKAICAVEHCGKPVTKRGFCGAHYKRFWRYGSPLGGSTGYGAAARWLDAHVGYEGDGCLPWPFAKCKDGYGRVWDGERMAVTSRVMCEKANGPPPTPNHEAAHSCGKGNIGCIHPKHLRWATSLENSGDQVVHGTVANGERNGHAKLSVEDIRRIRAMRGVESQSKIAKQFGIRVGHVSRIQTRKRWQHIL